MDKIDKKFEDLGFELVEDKPKFIKYEKLEHRKFIHVISIKYHSDGKHIIQSYNFIGGAKISVGMTYDEAKLSAKKMKKYRHRFNKYKNKGKLPKYRNFVIR